MGLFVVGVYIYTHIIIYVTNFFHLFVYSGTMDSFAAGGGFEGYLQKGELRTSKVAAESDGDSGVKKRKKTR